VHKAGAVFNLEKLDWMNGEYIKKMDLKEFAQAVKNFNDKEVDERVLKLEQQRVHRLGEVGKGLEFFSVKELEYDPKILIWKKSDQKTTVNSLEMLVEELGGYEEGYWESEKLQEKIIKTIADRGMKNGDVLWPMRVALTGLEKSPTPFEVAEILGKEKTLSRLRQAIEKLQKI